MSKKGKKKSEFDKRVLSLTRDFDYFHKLSKAEAEWLQKFIREEYSNDHSKADSIYREAFGEEYEKGRGNKNSWGKEIGVKQEVFTSYNEKMRDLINVAKTFNSFADGTDDEEKDMEKRITLLQDKEFGDLEDFVDFSGLKEDKTSIASLLKHYTYLEVLDLLKKDLLEKILEYDCDLKLIIDNYTNRVMLLCLKSEKIYKRDEKLAQKMSKQIKK